jgi:hypothetical protein
VAARALVVPAIELHLSVQIFGLSVSPTTPIDKNPPLRLRLRLQVILLEAIAIDKRV